MKLAVFFSGGKDSTYSIFLAKNMGHEVKCLLSVFPRSEESQLLHHPNLKWTSLQSKSMQIPQLTITSESNESDDELMAFEKILSEAIKKYDVEGVVHGGIKSKFQKEKFEQICGKFKLTVLAPLWGKDPLEYMNELVSLNFTFIITSVSSGGLDNFWLGKEINRVDIGNLYNLSHKFGFNLNFEGGEAETFIVNCPLFLSAIKINQAKKFWDGYRGRFEIVDASLNYNA